MKDEIHKFEVIILGILFDPLKKKILIARRESDPYIKKLDWCFPGGRMEVGENIDDVLKRKMKLKTGYSVKNIGTFFSETYKENPEMVSISFLTKVFEGEENPGDDIVELRWINPKDIDNYFKVPIHKKLNEFLLELI